MAFIQMETRGLQIKCVHQQQNVDVTRHVGQPPKPDDHHLDILEMSPPSAEPRTTTGMPLP
jgi:hypothetical protein